MVSLRIVKQTEPIIIIVVQLGDDPLTSQSVSSAGWASKEHNLLDARNTRSWLSQFFLFLSKLFLLRLLLPRIQRLSGRIFLSFIKETKRRALFSPSLSFPWWDWSGLNGLYLCSIRLSSSLWKKNKKGFPSRSSPSALPERNTIM